MISVLGGGGLEPEDTLIVRECVALCGDEEESTALAVKAKLPDWVGVPEILPVEGAKERPAGRLPEEMLQA